jgi:hypothetical protein
MVHGKMEERTMRKFMNIFAAALIMLAAVSCEKNEVLPDNNSEGKIVTLKASINNGGTKTSLGQGVWEEGDPKVYPVLWSEGDAIALINNDKLFKFVLDDESKASFKGELKILPDAQQVEAYQTNRNILLSRQAEMTTEPQLEIYADDVKASHGATTGQLDDSALFYMQQRCISRETARKLLLCAFFEDVLRTLPNEQMQEDIVEKINEYIG